MHHLLRRATYYNVKSILEKYNDSFQKGTMYFCGDWDTRYENDISDVKYKISEYIHTNINNANIK